VPFGTAECTAGSWRAQQPRATPRQNLASCRRLRTRFQRRTLAKPEVQLPLLLRKAADGNVGDAGGRIGAMRCGPLPLVGPGQHADSSVSRLLAVTDR
jgi:hypothetical protein